MEPLIAALKINDSDLRRVATDVLVAIGAPAVEPLIAALKDNDSHVRRAVADALEKIGGPGVVEALAEYKQSQKEAESGIERYDLAQIPWQFRDEINKFNQAKPSRKLDIYEITTLEVEYDPPQDLPCRVVGTAWAPIVANHSLIQIFVRNVLCELDPDIKVTHVQGGVYMQFVLDFEVGCLEIQRLGERRVFRFKPGFANRIRKSLQKDAIIVDFTDPNMPQKSPPKPWLHERNIGSVAGH